MIDSARFPTRRATLAAILAMTVAACSDNSSQQQSQAQPAKNVDPVKTAATAPEADGSVDMEKLLQPGALPDKFLGDASAPVTIVEYASMTCGHCAHFHETTLPAIKEKYIDTGKARLILREFPFDPRAAAAFMLARCAPNDNYFPMIDVLFHQQDAWARAEDAQGALLQISRQAGFTKDSFESCLRDQALLDNVTAVKQRGENDFGVNATPTFFINGKKYGGSLSVEQMSAVIDSLL